MFFWMDSNTVSSLQLSPETTGTTHVQHNDKGTQMCMCVCLRTCVCLQTCVCVYVSVCVRKCVCTFGCGQHGGGQFTLLGLYVGECEPARVAVGDHRHHVMGSRQVT